MIQPYRYSLPVPQSLEQKAYNNLVLYGKTNVYPQIVREVVSNCGIGKAATDLYANFLIGDGFIDSTLNDIEINENGDTVLDLLRFIANSYALFDGVSLHFDYNTFLDISDITFLDFDFVRVGNPANNSKDKVYIWDNWAGEGLTYNSPMCEYARYNFKETDEQRYQKYSNFDDFTGEVLYYGTSCNRVRVYPKAPSDPVLRDMMTWKSLSVFRQKSSDNNFVSSKIVEMLGTMENQNAAKDLASTFKNTLGAENAGNLLVIPGGYQDADGNLKSAFQIHDVNITTYDNLFVETTAQVENNIVRTFNIPSLLLSLDNRNSLNTTTGALKEAYAVYNNFTNDKRKEITSLLNKFLHKHINIPSGSSFNIKPKQFLDFNIQ